MLSREFLREETITIKDLYRGSFPDRKDAFWDYVRPQEFDIPLEIRYIAPYKLSIMLASQYRVEDIRELVDLLDGEQLEILDKYMKRDDLDKSIILIAGDRIIDGNHRALAAALSKTGIRSIDLADLE